MMMIAELHVLLTRLITLRNTLPLPGEEIGCIPIAETGALDDAIELVRERIAIQSSQAINTTGADYIILSRVVNDRAKVARLDR